jgi:hypothetical protein
MLYGLYVCLYTVPVLSLYYGKVSIVSIPVPVCDTGINFSAKNIDHWLIIIKKFRDVKVFGPLRKFSKHEKC